MTPTRVTNRYLAGRRVLALDGVRAIAVVMVQARMRFSISS